MVSQDHLHKTLEYYLQQRASKIEEIKSIDIMVRQLQKELGESPIEETESPGQAGNDILPVLGTSESPSRRIRPDEFFGMSQTEAAKSYLRSVGRAVSIDQLVGALRDGGAQLGGANPRKTLYVSLARNPLKEFVTPKEGFIGLREFYPSLPKSTVKSKAGHTGGRAKKAKSNRSLKKAKPQAAARPRPAPNASGARPVKAAVHNILMVRREGQSLVEIVDAVEKVLGRKVAKVGVASTLRGKEFVKEGDNYRLAK